MIDCTKEQHRRLQKLIGQQLAKDRLVNRPDLGKGVESGACWDLGVYLSEIGKLDAKPETKKANNYALNPENKDGFDSKWQKAARVANAATLTNCITCKMVPRQRRSDKCNQCQLAVFFSK